MSLLANKCVQNGCSSGAAGSLWLALFISAILAYALHAAAIRQHVPNAWAQAPSHRPLTSISSSFCSVIDFKGRIFGLHRISARFPFSETTSPVLGSTSQIVGR